ncbi:hypothetical protein WEN_01715 [Mycoplasma wenyonii str. Massachusetts]|uniref:Uncharacterized protein n=1 Tax=Mycoplasma wenyonii (strain Massachusetts) TaxID=1197325 RepID=I6YAZ0_MYCWM|nr:hypothetical protein [Mycoplasma wenyonii]AFN65136.1 hypothetical protein WEN_01715 [Mycoplasma wenyonii str. Massachusetts]
MFSSDDGYRLIQKGDKEHSQLRRAIKDRLEEYGWSFTLEEVEAMMEGREYWPAGTTDVVDDLFEEINAGKYKLT